MANRFFSPDQQFADSTGAALSGAQLFFYTSGTSTKLSTFSDSALTIANANPVVLDSTGRAGSVFLQNLKYKVVLAPSTDTDPPTSPIWTMDPVYSSDFSTNAQFFSGSGNPNGSVAGTQGSASTSASVYWDFTNNILYVCTTTGNAAAAVWTAVNASAAAQVVPPPSGRLTLTSATPVLSSDVTAATAVIYTPYVSNNLVPIYNGTTLIPLTFSETTLTLASQHAADTLYDIFMFNNSGTATLVTGPAWSNNTAGSCARGTGAGTTQLTRISGLWVNSVSMTGRNGASTFSIAANQATYLGTMYTDHTAGQVTVHVDSFGQNRKIGIWNAYNRVPVVMTAGDSTATWSYGTNTIRASNAAPASYAGASFNVGSGTACNGLNLLCGLAEETTNITFQQRQPSTSGISTGWAAHIGIGINSTTAFTGLLGELSFAVSSGTITIGVNTAATTNFAPALGLNTICALEVAASGSITFNGTSSSMLLQATYRA